MNDRERELGPVRAVERPQQPRDVVAHRLEVEEDGIGHLRVGIALGDPAEYRPVRLAQ